MKTCLTVAVCLAVSVALAGPPAPRKPGIETSGYAWNADGGEAMQALALKGDAKRGEEAWEVCSACHLPNGAGRPDGTFPQLAGQHSTVLIKQIADIRAGLRDSPIMYPFAAALVDPQELADVAAYIETLKIPRDNGKGPGTALDLGKTLYLRDCQSCHLVNGEGSRDRFSPVLAGQHYKYLRRQALEIRDGKRRNANPDMVRVIKAYDDREIDAIVDYMSRLEMPAQKPKKK